LLFVCGLAQRGTAGDPKNTCAESFAPHHHMLSPRELDGLNMM